MKLIAVTQRVTKEVEYQETRDCLDQRWANFFASSNLLPLMLPNHLPTVEKLLQYFNPQGVLLTGGNDLIDYGGDTPQRDNVEQLLIRFSESQDIPLLGICRGMQAIQHYYGVHLIKVEGHIKPTQNINIHGKAEQVNSYHSWGTHETKDPLEIWANSSDGVVKAIRHSEKPILGIMWHPERHDPFRPPDIQLLQNHFGEQT